MAKTLEQLATEIYNECLEEGEEVTKEEALKMAEMELEAKAIKSYTKSEKPRKKVKKEVKLDDTKVALIKMLQYSIEEVTALDISNISIKNPQKEITFNIGTDEYSISLIKHRKVSK